MFYRDPKTGQFPTGLLTGNGGPPFVAQSGQADTLGLSSSGGIIRGPVSLLRGDGDDEAGTSTSICMLIEREGNILVGRENETAACKARIIFGQQSISATLECDIINGMIITLPGSAITLTAAIDDGVPDDEITSAIRIGAFVVYMPHNKSVPAQRTLRNAAMAMNDTVVLAVPRFASAVKLLGSIVGATFTIEQYRDAAATMLVSANTIPIAPPYYSTPIANETRYVKVTNTGAATALRAIFELTV